MAISSLQYGEIIRNIYDQTLGGIKTWSGGKLFTISHTLTRPADATAYASGDSMASSTSSPAVMLLSGAAVDANADGIVYNVTISTDEVYTTAVTIRVHFYNVEVTPSNDNAAQTTTYAGSSGYLGSCDVSIYGNTGGDGSKGYNDSVRIPFNSVTGNLWIKHESRSAIATASGQLFRTIVKGEKL